MRPSRWELQLRGTSAQLGFTFQKTPKKERWTESIKRAGQQDGWLVFSLSLSGFAAVTHLKELHRGPITSNAHREITNEMTAH